MMIFVIAMTEPTNLELQLVPMDSFYCLNVGFKGLNISSSKVNDGLCDCCDGGDEYLTGVVCLNTCDELGNKEKQKKAQELDSFRKGMLLKEQYIQQGRQAKIDRVDHLSKLKLKLEQLEKDLVSAEAIKKEKEETEKVILEKRKAAGKPEEDDEKEDDYFKESEEKIEGDKKEGDKIEGEKEEEEEEEKKEEKDQSSEIHPPVVNDQKEDLKVEPKETEEEKKEREEETKVIEEAKQARNKYDEVKKEVENIKRDFTKLESDLKVELGADNEFYPIQGQCYKISNEYTYEFCPFDKVRQGTTALGQWGKWEGNNYKIMFYDDGLKCFNGPKRSTKITLICGADNAILEVSEPAKCEYAMTFSTPAACDLGQIAILEHHLTHWTGDDTQHMGAIY